MSGIRTALVCGATSGLGEASARALSAQGMNVVLTARRASRLEEVAASLTAAAAVPADLTEPAAAEAVVTAAEAAFGQVDVLVINGGGPAPGTAADLGAEGARAAIELLLLPAVDLVHRILPSMRERRWGRIIAVGSSGVQQPLPGLAASNLGRAALAGYLKTLAGEVAGDGVTVNMVLPGRIRTDRVQSLDSVAAAAQGVTAEEVAERSRATIPAGRYGEAAEFAALVAFLASEGASYVTGSQLRCDGGLIKSY